MRALALAVAVFSTACFRLSDPVYAFKALRADAAPMPEFSLLLVTVKGSSDEDFNSIYFRNVNPDSKQYLVQTTDTLIYRVFAPRTVKDGHFLIMLPPGVYELAYLDSISFWKNKGYKASKDARAASRIYVTRPGVYDLGTLQLRRKPWLDAYTIEAAGDAWSDSRRRMIESAIAGTSWRELYDSQSRP